MKNLIKSMWLRLGLPIYVVIEENKYIGPDIKKVTNYKTTGPNISSPFFVNGDFVYLTKRGAKNEGINLYKIYSWKSMLDDAKYIDIADKMAKEGKIASYGAYQKMAMTGVLDEEDIIDGDNNIIFRI